MEYLIPFLALMEYLVPFFGTHGVQCTLFWYSRSTGYPFLHSGVSVMHFVLLAAPPLPELE